MRERHFPRLCRTCDAPMARQERACWRCGTAWSDDPPLTVADTRPTVGVGRTASLSMTSEDDRWLGDGGRIGAGPVLAGT